MKIYNNSVLLELNDESLYKIGIESVENSLNLCKKIKTPVDQKYEIYVYWIGDNVNYKHSVVLKSFIATQNLKNAKLKIYSDVDVSNKDVFLEYKKYNQIEFHVFDIEKEMIGTEYEKNFMYSEDIKYHRFNPAYESDFFRLFMLNKYGGFYIDFDVLLLRDLSPLLNYDFMYQWGAHPNNMINGAIMHLKKDSLTNNIATNILLNTKATPGIGSLSWASDLYLKIKDLSDELIIFPAAFFNSEWQSSCNESINYLIEPFKKHEYSNMLYDGAFTWHWHNRWNEDITKGSKFDILDKKFDEIIKNNKKINENT